MGMSALSPISGHWPPLAAAIAVEGVVATEDGHLHTGRVNSEAVVDGPAVSVLTFPVAALAVARHVGSWLDLFANKEDTGAEKPALATPLQVGAILKQPQDLVLPWVLGAQDQDSLKFGCLVRAQTCRRVVPLLPRGRAVLGAEPG